MGERIAAVIIDALPGRAGIQPASPEFMRFLREQTEAREILLIQDGVISLRVASGGMQSFYDHDPDLTTVGKIIGGGAVEIGQLEADPAREVVDERYERDRAGIDDRPRVTPKAQRIAPPTGRVAAGIDSADAARGHGLVADSNAPRRSLHRVERAAA